MINEGNTSTRYETGSSRRNQSENKRTNQIKPFHKPRNLSRDFAGATISKYIKNKVPINPGRKTQIDPPFIEDRFSKTQVQPLVCYDQYRNIDSPYRGGAKNLRYSSPNYISNAVFYDQTSNLSQDRAEMYKTTAQSDFTPPKANLGQISSRTVDLRPNTGYYSPSRHKIQK